MVWKMGPINIKAKNRCDLKLPSGKSGRVSAFLQPRVSALMTQHEPQLWQSRGFEEAISVNNEPIKNKFRS